MNLRKRILKQVMAGILSLVLAGGPVFLLPVYSAEVPDALYSAGAVLMDAD